jgi:hypothetical protein
MPALTDGPMSDVGASFEEPAPFTVRISFLSNLQVCVSQESQSRCAPFWYRRVDIAFVLGNE